MIQQPKERRASTVQDPIPVSSENKHATANNDTLTDSISLRPVLLTKMDHGEMITKIKKERNALERKKLLILKSVSLFKIMNTLYL